MSVYTMLDILALAAGDKLTGIIDEAAHPVPELSGFVKRMGQDVKLPNVGLSRGIKGRTYETTVRTSLPGGTFRNANEGATPTKSTYEKRTVETAIFNPRWQADKGVALAHPDGVLDFVVKEASAILQGAMQSLGTQFYYGRGTGDAKGHVGLVDIVQSDMTVDAGGTTAGTGSSVYAVKFGLQNVIWVIGQEATLDVSPEREETVYDTNNKPYTAIVQEILGFVGVQAGHKQSVGRIKDITADSGKTLNDALLADLMALFPTAIVPDAIFMTRRSRTQLQKSRTATTATGVQAPTPTDYEGIPIVATDSLLNTETLT